MTDETTDDGYVPWSRRRRLLYGAGGRVLMLVGLAVFVGILVVGWLAAHPKNDPKATAVTVPTSAVLAQYLIQPPPGYTIGVDGAHPDGAQTLDEISSEYENPTKTHGDLVAAGFLQAAERQYVSPASSGVVELLQFATAQGATTWSSDEILTMSTPATDRPQPHSVPAAGVPNGYAITYAANQHGRYRTVVIVSVGNIEMLVDVNSATTGPEGALALARAEYQRVG